MKIAQKKLTILIQLYVTFYTSLTFDTVSEGTLFIIWSETPVPDALAYFTPSKPVPAFKYKKDGGRSELIRGFRGSTRHRFFDGFCQFFKQCRDLEGSVSLLCPIVRIFVRSNEGVISPFPLGELIPLHKIHAVAAVGSADTSFDGVDRLSQDYFLGTGTKQGGSLALI
jgi:hypothetical protein